MLVYQMLLHIIMFLSRTGKLLGGKFILEMSHKYSSLKEMLDLSFNDQMI